MKSYEQIKSEMKRLERQMAEAKKREKVEALKKVRKLCREFGFTEGMLKASMATGGESRTGSNALRGTRDGVPPPPPLDKPGK